MSTIILTPPSFALDTPNAPERHVVLVHPEIPQNTGNIARLCAGTHTWLHLVAPLGYILSDRHLKRAGLDYWPKVTLSLHDSLEALLELLPWERTWLFTKSAPALYTSVSYPRGSVLVFGRESRGLDPEFVDAHPDRGIRIPTSSHVRSLNLSNSVALGVYEILRQEAWPGEEPKADHKPPKT